MITALALSAVLQCTDNRNGERFKVPEGARVVIVGQCWSFFDNQGRPRAFCGPRSQLTCRHAKQTAAPKP